MENESPNGSKKLLCEVYRSDRLDTYSRVLPGIQEDAVRLIDVALAIDAALATAIKKSKADKT